MNPADYYIQLPSGPPMQGDLWDNVPMHVCDPPRCLGIIITPRCDLAHDKSPVINYLPVVSLDELMAIHGGFALLEREQVRLRQILRNEAQTLGAADLFDINVSPRRILALIREGKTATPPRLGPRLEAHAKMFEEQLLALENVEANLTKPRLIRDELATLVAPKLHKKYKTDVVRNTFADLHFLPPAPPFLPKPSVALLRHIGTCHIDFIRTAANCSSAADWSTMVAERNWPPALTSAERPERLLRLKSPHLESLMSRFASIFLRVGVRDLSSDELTMYVDPSLDV